MPRRPWRTVTRCSASSGATPGQRLALRLALTGHSSRSPGDAPARSSVTPSTHTFRVRILGGFNAPPHARQIWRELELTGDQTLGDLGEAIPLAFGFDDPHLWSFFLSGKPWDEATEYALSPAPDPVGGRRARAADRLRIPDVPAGKEFLFLFDYGDEWHFGVRLVRTGKAPNPGVRYPQVVASHGQAPPQYPAAEDDWDEQAEDEAFLAQWEQAEAEAIGSCGRRYRLGHARRCQPGTWQRPAGACGPVSAGTTLPSKRSGGPPRWTRRCRPMTSRCGWPRPAR